MNAPITTNTSVRVWVGPLQTPSGPERDCWTNRWFYAAGRDRGGRIGLSHHPREPAFAWVDSNRCRTGARS